MVLRHGTMMHPALLQGPHGRAARTLLMSLLLALALPGAALANNDDDDGPCPDGLPRVADLGIKRIEGNFAVGYQRRGQIVHRVFRFYEEPRVAAVDPTGPAAGKLREGDVLVA